MAQDILKTVAKKMRERRKVLHISQEELAFRAEVHRTYIGNIERAETNVGIKTLEKIAKAMGLEAKDLL